MPVCQVVNGDDNFGWGAVVNFQKKANQSKVSIHLFCYSLAKNIVSVRNCLKIFLMSLIF